ncbi:MAG TPA: hypothetical protein V6D06_14485 [Trichocoleus sp.]
MNLSVSPRRCFSVGLGIAVLATSVASAQVALAGRCRTVAYDWDGYIDVRSSPEVRWNNLSAMVANDTELDVIGERGDWLEIFEPERGWVEEGETRRICSRDSRPRHRDYDDYYDDYDD